MTPVAADRTAAPELSPEADAFVRAVGTAADLPAFVRNVRAIGTVAANLDARVALLEQAIVRDVALSAKVLRIANSVALGAGAATSGGGVVSVKQAIMLLGYDRVQHLSTAASVFEQIERDAPAVRDLLVESVLSANHSLQLSFATGFERPELAYLCGLFRRLGEVLVACYRPRVYQTWMQAVQGGGASHDGAEARHFGFTFEEVGVALARRWGMPAGVVHTMRTYLGASAGNELLHLITQSSAEIVRCLYGAGASTEDVSEIRARFAARLGVDAATMTDCLTAAVEDARPTLSTMQVDLHGWMQRRGETATTRQRPRAHGASLVTASIDGPSAIAVETRTAPVDTDSPKESKLRDAVRQLVEHRQQDMAAFSVGVVTDSTLRAACEAGYERGVLGISSEDFKLIRGRVSIGPGGAELSRTFLLRPTASFGPLGAALQQRLDLFVELSGADAKHYGRDRLLKELSPSHFALLPLVLEEKLLGCLYFDSTIETVESTDTSKQLLCDLRDQLVAAFALRRAATTKDATESVA